MTPPAPQRPPRPALSWRVAALAALALLAAAGAARADEVPPDGVVVQVPTAITTEATHRLRSLLHGPLKRFEAGAGRRGGVFHVVLDFNPDNRRNESDDFGACYGLAKYLRSLPAEHRGVQTVAYVRADVRRHSVLPLLACGEIVLASRPEARFGQVVPAGRGLPKAERAAYEDVASGRYPLALVRKMYEADLEVIKSGDQYLDAAGKARGQPVGELARGETALYTFALAKRLGLCKQRALDTLEDVIVEYQVPRGGLHRALDRTHCWRIPVKGTINGELKEQLKRRVERALRNRATLLILELECGDGESEKAYELGLYLANLNKDRPHNPVETIAFVTNRSRNTAAFLAFGCTKIVMQPELRDGDEVSQPGARLGDFERYIQDHPSLEKARRELAQPEKGGDNALRRAELQLHILEQTAALEETLRKNLADVAARHFYPSVLAAGMFSKELRIHAVESTKGKVVRRTLLSEEDLKADEAGPKLWRSTGLVKPATPRERDHYLTLTAARARDLGVAAYLADDFAALCEKEGLDPAQVPEAGADWLEGLADFLRSPWTSVVLVMLGITCLILELKMPGVGLPGVVSAICFVLFFWSHSQLNGQMTWLAVLLFVLGLLLVGLEVFVLPGFGVAGISGVLLVLSSLGLMAYGHWPRSNEEWVGFGQKAGPLGLAMLGSLALAALLARYLPHIPYANRLLLKPPDEAAEAGEIAPENFAHAELAALVGAIGVAATPLRPAGKTQFGDAFIDVVAEGGYIPPGTRVQVVEVEGYRVVVKEV